MRAAGRLQYIEAIELDQNANDNEIISDVSGIFCRK